MVSDRIDYVAMGRRIRALRKERNVTQAELASQLQISTSFLGLIERGARVPSLETLSRLCALMNVSLDQIVMGTQADQPGTRLSAAETPGQKIQMLNDIMRELNLDLSDWIPPKP